MNIWQWVMKLQDDLTEAGQAHNAELIERLTNDVCDLEVARAEALLPEAKALCRTLDNPWLEVFVRHWEMRNRLGNRGEGDMALADATALFEFAHRPDTIQCPQSVCVTQDLSACYANIDGPGWVEERIAVCDETLARITPKWGCFQCLSTEKAEALRDAGRFDDALAYLQAQMQLSEDAGEEVNAGMLEIRNKLLIELGRFDEALQHIAAEEARTEGPEWRNIAQPRDVIKAHALAAMGRDEEAFACLPDPHELHPAELLRWAKAAAPLLQRHPDENSWQLGRRLQQGLDHFAAVGAHRHVVDMAAVCIPLALQRDAQWSARRMLQLARQHQARLRVDHGAAAALDALDRSLAAHGHDQALPVPAERLLHWLNHEQGDAPRSPERDVQWLQTALQQRPDDAELCEQTARALQACGAGDQAHALLFDYLRRHRTSGQEQPLAYVLLGMLLEDAGASVESVEQLARLYDDDHPVTAHWCRAQQAWRHADWAAVEQQCRALLALSPGSHGARRLLASGLMRQQRFADAAAVQRELVDALPDDASPGWDYLTAASAAEDWAGVRAMAERLQLNVDPGEGPIEEHWGWALIRFHDNGESLDYMARRTGPVTAQVQENAAFRHPQHARDLVVFDAQPLVPPPDNDEQRSGFIPTFAAVHVLRSGQLGRSWPVDGPHPGKAALDAFVDALQARGWNVSLHSNDQYRLADRDHDMAELPGVFFSVAAPDGTAPAVIDQTLRETTADWPHRLCWLRLAEACKVDTRPHQDVIDRYGL